LPTGCPARSEIEGFVLVSESSWDSRDAIHLLKEHLGARLLEWEGGAQSVSPWAQNPLGSADILCAADLRSEPDVRLLDGFESALHHLAAEVRGRKVFKLLLVGCGFFRSNQDELTRLGYHPRNQFPIDDAMGRINADPDREIHDAIARVAKFEGCSPLEVSEEMLFLLETKEWRHGWLELDLFLRECMRNMGVSSVLTCKILPKWFESPPQPSFAQQMALIRAALLGLGIRV
jgi:hypothetical protein